MALSKAEADARARRLSVDAEDLVFGDDVDDLRTADNDPMDQYITDAPDKPKLTPGRRADLLKKLDGLRPGKKR
jgi:hypothetical protein